MKTGRTVAGLLCLAWCLPATLSSQSYTSVEEMEGYSSSMEYSGSGDWTEDDSLDEMDSDPGSLDSSRDSRTIQLGKEKNGNSMFKVYEEDNIDLRWLQSQDHVKKDLLESTKDLLAVVAAGVVALTMATAMVLFMVYKLKKKDEGSYDTDNTSEKYQKPQKKEEFFV